jgi:hypothetical protein
LLEFAVEPYMSLRLPRTELWLPADTSTTCITADIHFSIVIFIGLCTKAYKGKRRQFSGPRVWD